VHVVWVQLQVAGLSAEVWPASAARLRINITKKILKETNVRPFTNGSPRKDGSASLDLFFVAGRPRLVASINLSNPCMYKVYSARKLLLQYL